MSDTYKQHLTNKLHGFYPASCHTVSWNFLVIRGLCVLDGVSFILYLFIYLFIQVPLWGDKLGQFSLAFA